MAQVLSPQTAQASPPALQAWIRLLRAHAASTRSLSSQLQAEHGLTINDYEALFLLSHAEDRRLKRVDLARRLLLTPSGVTRLLEGLERAGLVERTSCPTDLRVAYAQLTEDGTKKFDAVSCAHVAAVHKLFEQNLTPKELTTLAGLLERLPGVSDSDAPCTPPAP
jgi:DNA-binding MarR family transcriptional regulator